MIREFMLGFSELLFYVLGGTPIMMTFWIFPYVIVMVFLMMWPILLYDYIGRMRNYALGLVSVSFLPIFFVTLGPPLIQLQMVSECRSFETVVSSELSEAVTLEMRECREKDNYYGEYGEWTIQGTAQQ